MTARITAVHPVLMVKDVASSVKFFERLGFEALFSDSNQDPKYAGVARDGVTLHLQWHDKEEWDYPVDRPTYRFPTENIEALYDELSRLEKLSRSELKNTPWGTREFHVLDPDGNGLQFYTDLSRTLANPSGPTSHDGSPEAPGGEADR